MTQDITERKQAEFSALCFSKLGQQLSVAASAAEAFRVISNVTNELFGWDAFWVKLYDRGNDSIGDWFAIDTINGRQVIEEATGFEEPNDFHQGIIRQGARLIVRDPAALGFSPPGPTPFGDKSRPSAVLTFVPIRSRGIIVGLLSVQSYTPARTVTGIWKLFRHWRINAKEPSNESGRMRRGLNLNPSFAGCGTSRLMV